MIGGASEIDESLITGETARRKVAAGATVYAGSLNYSGALTLRVTAAGGATLLDEIERLLEKAASAKSRTVRLADRAARFYAPMVHATAALTFVGWWLAGASLHDAVVTAIAVLIITCPCALALAIPAVQVVASGALFRAGVILNAGDAIERLARSRYRRLRQDRHADAAGAARGQRRRDRSRAAADGGAAGAVEPASAGGGAGARRLSHASPYDGATEEPGQGVRAMIDGVEARLGSAEFCGLAHIPLVPAQAGIQSQDRKQRSWPWVPAFAGTSGDGRAGISHIYFVYGSRTATFAISQKLRPDAAEVVSALRRLGLDLHILSGDRDDGGAAGGRGARHRALAAAN